MSSRAGQRNARVWVRVHLINENGVADTLVKKRHLEEGIPRDDDGTRYLVDKWGDRVYFNDWRTPNPKPYEHIPPKKYTKVYEIAKCSVCSTVYNKTRRKIRGCPRCAKDRVKHG